MPTSSLDGTSAGGYRADMSRSLSEVATATDRWRTSALVATSILDAASQDHKPRSHALGKIDRALYPGWGATVAALLGLRVAHVPLVLAGAALPALLATGPVVLAAVCGGLALAEGGMAVARLVTALTKRRHVSAAVVGHRKAQFEDRCADSARGERGAAAGPPRRRAVARWDVPQRCRAHPITAVMPPARAALARRLCEEKLDAVEEQVSRRRLAALRDGQIQSLGATATCATAFCTFAGASSHLLHGLSILGGGFGMLMSAAHIATAIPLLRMARKAVDTIDARRQALGKQRFLAALRDGVDARTMVAESGAGAFGLADEPTKSLARFYRAASLVSGDMLAERGELRRQELRQAKTRLAYGCATLLTNGALLTLTVLGLTTLAATTAGLCLLALAAALGLAWLLPLIKRILAGPPQQLSSSWQAGKSARSLLAALHEHDPFDVIARAGQALGNAHEGYRCAGPDHADRAKRLRLGQRWLIAAQVFLHLRGNGDGDPESMTACCMAQSLLQALGADRQVLTDLRAASTPDEIEMALRLVRRFLAGDFLETSVVWPGKRQRGVRFDLSVQAFCYDENEPLLRKQKVE
ncbi:hypothetical protein [Cupriavidus sp. AU9028]|uniref:hypothetical protein n=1 Tax=Cupriavidus sp. AU9028 TaxID=2871157 RepID=UPI001C986C28|nr:hypothetical protein [Cupriavidus sp. AU9028]MBY4895520.1 hypothetical protein [Cupriavidus sp. AU9028]